LYGSVQPQPERCGEVKQMLLVLVLVLVLLLLY
jgi:hypothetical protein